MWVDAIKVTYSKIRVDNCYFQLGAVFSLHGSSLGFTFSTEFSVWCLIKFSEGGEQIHMTSEASNILVSEPIVIEQESTSERSGNRAWVSESSWIRPDPTAESDPLQSKFAA